MNEPFSIKRIDRFQRILITFFFQDTLSDKERVKVVWMVRLVTMAGALVFAMLITLVTESILYFFLCIIVFGAWYVILKTAGMLRKRPAVNK
jgi:hypothetical protein